MDIVAGIWPVSCLCGSLDNDGVAVMWLLSRWCSRLDVPLQLSGCYLVGAIDLISLQSFGCYLVCAADWMIMSLQLSVCYLVGAVDWL